MPSYKVGDVVEVIDFQMTTYGQQFVIQHVTAATVVDRKGDHYSFNQVMKKDAGTKLDTDHSFEG